MRSAADPAASLGHTEVTQVLHNARKHYCGNYTIIKMVKQRIYHFRGEEQRRAHQLELWILDQTATSPSQRASSSVLHQLRQNFRSKQRLDFSKRPKMMKSVSDV